MLVEVAVLLRHGACAAIYAAIMAAPLIRSSFVACTIRNMFWKYVKTSGHSGLMR